MDEQLNFLTTGEIEFRKWVVERLQKIEALSMQLDIISGQLIEIKQAIVEGQTAQAKIDLLAEQIRQNNEKLQLFRNTPEEAKVK